MGREFSTPDGLARTNDARGCGGEAMTVRRLHLARWVAASAAAALLVSGCTVASNGSSAAADNSSSAAASVATAGAAAVPGASSAGTTGASPTSSTASTGTIDSSPADSSPAGSRPAGSSPQSTSTSTAASTGDLQTSVTATPAEANQVVESAIKDVERYWTTEYPKLSGGKPFQPVKGGYHPYTKTKLPPACGQEPAQYQENAFYCPQGDFIAWDSQVLIPELLSEFGPLLVGVVIAHEYGHAIQTRLGIAQQPTIVLEQQADCFGGAWAGDVQAGHSTFGKITPQQLDNTLAGLLQLRDQPGTAAQTEGAHGNAFDRVRALQDGFESGPAPCAKYSASNLPVTEVPFQTPQDAATGGDLPSFQDTVTVLTQSLQSYWSQAFPELDPGQRWKTLTVRPFNPSSPPACQGRVPPDPGAAETAFYCATGDFAAFDSVQLGPALYQRIGDNAVGMLLGGLFAQAAQQRRGESATGRAGQLEVDCLAGTWTNNLLTGNSADDIQLSPGDLDEAVAALLVFNRANESGQVSGFDRIASFRKGTLQGLSGCS
jgi:predicted metalloprotease